MAIAPAAEVARILGCAVTDPAMLQLMASAQTAVEKFCDRKFENAQRTEYHNGRGVKYLYVGSAPITDSAGAITRDSANIDIWDDLDRDYEAADKIDDDDLVIESPDDGQIYYEGSSFLNGKQNIKVTYYGGFTAALMPEDVKQAFIILVQNWYMHRGYRTDRTGGRGELDYPTLPVETSLPEQVRDLLTPYRRTVWATGFGSEA